MVAVIAVEEYVYTSAYFGLKLGNGYWCILEFVVFQVCVFLLSASYYLVITTG